MYTHRCTAYSVHTRCSVHMQMYSVHTQMCSLHTHTFCNVHWQMYSVHTDVHYTHYTCRYIIHVKCAVVHIHVKCPMRSPQLTLREGVGEGLGGGAGRGGGWGWGEGRLPCGAGCGLSFPRSSRLPSARFQPPSCSSPSSAPRAAPGSWRAGSVNGRRPRWPHAETLPTSQTSWTEERCANIAEKTATNIILIV